MNEDLRKRAIETQNEMLAYYEKLDGPDGAITRGVRGAARASMERKMDRLTQIADQAREAYHGRA